VLTRRGLLLGGASLVALAACGNDSTAGSEGGSWEFTDDRGKKVTGDTRPTKIVAQVSAAAALWDLGVRPVGTFGESGASTVLRGSVPSSVPWIGQTWGEFNVEKFASLNPDLLIAPMQQKDQLWYVPTEAVTKIEAICPTVGVNYVQSSVDKVIDRYAALAGALGGSTVTPAKQDFSAASSQLSTVARSKSDLRIAFVSGTKDNFYVGNPAMFADLTYLKNLGLNLLTPSADPKEPHWEVLSWEQAGKYPLDVVLYDSRSPSYITTDLAKYPTLAKMPAVQAKQLVPWNPETPTSWAAFAPALSTLATALTPFRPVLAG
jgi:iron complex transport system substrate-binding protein